MKTLDLCGLWAGYAEPQETLLSPGVEAEAVMLANVVSWKRGWKMGAPGEDKMFLRMEVVKFIEGTTPKEFRIVLPKKRYIFRTETVYSRETDEGKQTIEVSGDIYGPSPLSREMPPVKPEPWASEEMRPFVPNPQPISVGSSITPGGILTINEVRGQNGLPELLGIKLPETMIDSSLISLVKDILVSNAK